MNIYYTQRHTNIQCILVLRYLTSDKHHAHMYIVSLFENCLIHVVRKSSFRRKSWIQVECIIHNFNMYADWIQNLTFEYSYQFWKKLNEVWRNSINFLSLAIYRKYEAKRCGFGGGAISSNNVCNALFLQVNR